VRRKSGLNEPPDVVGEKVSRQTRGPLRLKEGGHRNKKTGLQKRRGGRKGTFQGDRVGVGPRGITLSTEKKEKGEEIREGKTEFLANKVKGGENSKPRKVRRNHSARGKGRRGPKKKRTETTGLNELI